MSRWSWIMRRQNWSRSRSWRSNETVIQQKRLVEPLRGSTSPAISRGRSPHLDIVGSVKPQRFHVLFPVRFWTRGKLNAREFPSWRRDFRVQHGAPAHHRREIGGDWASRIGAVVRERVAADDCGRYGHRAAAGVGPVVDDRGRAIRNRCQREYPETHQRSTHFVGGDDGVRSAALIVDSNGNTQRATTAGTTGGSAPTWPTMLGATVTDGTVTWTLVALGKAGVTNVTAPAWSTALNGSTSDGAAVTGTLTWTLVALGPIPNLQTATLINSGGSSGGANQSAVFGPLIQGYTIPYALSEIFGQGAGQVIVVNVFDQTRHFTAVAAATFTFPASGNQVINLGHMGVSAVKVTNSGATVTYVEGSDFTVDHINGLITAVGGGLFGAGATVKVSFNYADPSKVADADLIGAITNGVYTGMQAWKLSYATFGFFPKILIAPEFGAGAQQQAVGSQDAVTASALTTIAASMRAVALVDSPPATQVATLISNRGATGNAWNTSSGRIILCGPQEKFFDTGIMPAGITISPSGTAVQ